MSSPRRLIEAVEVTESGVHVVRLMRIFDAASVTEFEKVLAYLMARGHFKLVVDLANVEFVASAGWGALTAEFRRVRDNGGDIRLAGMNPDVLDVFFLLELDSFMNAYDTLDEALSSFEIEQPQARVPAVQPKSAPPPAVMPTRENAAVEAQSAGRQEPVAEAPIVKKEAKKKRKQSAVTPVMNETALERPAAYEVTELRDSAVPPPGARLSGNTASSEAGTAHAVTKEARSSAPAEKESSFFAGKFESEDANGAYEKAPELALSAPAPLPAKKKPQKKQRRPQKNKSPKRPPQKTAKAPAASGALPAKEHKGPDGSAVAPALVLRGAEPRNDATLRAEDRHNSASSSFEFQEKQPFDDFEMQDIHDPWLSDEIDTLPEEFEIEEDDWQTRAGLEMDQSASFGEQGTEHTQLSFRKDAVDSPVRAERADQKRRMTLPGGKAASESFTATLETSRKTAPKKAASRKKKRLSRKRAIAAPPVAENAPAAVVPVLEAPSMAEPDVPFGQVVARARAVTRTKPKPLQKSANIIKVSSEGDYVELVRQIVKEHPHYGPTMIGKFFETRVDPPVRASRSTVYRWLRLAGLNTRDQRSGFAGTTEPPSSIETMPKDIVPAEA